MPFLSHKTFDHIFHFINRVGQNSQNGSHIFRGILLLKNNLPVLNHQDYSDIPVSSIKQPPNKIKRFLYGFGKGLTFVGFILFAIIGQFNFFHYPAGENQGLIFYGLACLCFTLFVFLTQATFRLPQSQYNIQKRENSEAFCTGIKDAITTLPKPQKIILLSAILFSLLTLLFTIYKPIQQQHWDVFILWLCSWVCYLLAFIPKSVFKIKTYWQKYHTDILLISILTFLGGVLRFYKLGLLPGFIDGDEGRFGLIILDILHGQQSNMFITTFGNSTMYFFFLAGVMKLFGVSVSTLRIGSAIGGTLTIPFLYLFAKSIANRRVAVISSIVLLASNFHLYFSRIMSVTSIQDGLVATASLYFLYTGLKNKSQTRMLLSGLLLGLGIYVYMGARLIILLIPIYLLFLFLIQKNIIIENRINLLHFFTILIIVCLPMVYWAITNPDAFNIRANQIGVFQSGWLAQESQKTNQPQWQLFLELFKQAFLTTIYYPSSGFHNSTWPMLDPFCSIFFVAGLLYSLLHTRDKRYLLLNGWFWSGILVGGAMVILPIFNTYRILIVFPVMCIFCAIGLERWLFLMAGNSRFYKSIQLLSVGLFLIIVSVFNVQHYFYNYLPYCRYENTNTHMASYIGSYVGKQDKDVVPYLLTYPYLEIGTHASMEFLGYGSEFHQYKEPLTAPPDDLDPSKRYVFFFIPDRIDELHWIQQQLPGGTMDTISDCNTKLLDIYNWP